MRNFILKYGVLFLAFSFAFSSCGKSDKPVDTVEGEQNIHEVQLVQEAPAVDPDIWKLEKVLSSMSDRAKEAMPDGNPYEFLADLQKVLESDASEENGSLFVLVDKQHYLPDGFVPAKLVPLTDEKKHSYTFWRKDLSLRADVEDALEVMAAAARREGINLLVSSTYRSYDYQVKLFKRYADADGYENALRYSAPAGTSQHQLGVAIDFGTIDENYAKTREGKWLYANAERFGWSLSFPQGYEDVTGYMWECWHFRYIGAEACAFQKKWFGNIQQFMMEFIYAWKNCSE